VARGNQTITVTLRGARDPIKLEAWKPSAKAAEGSIAIYDNGSGAPGFVAAFPLELVESIVVDEHIATS
jgi:hypothetical protein